MQSRINELLKKYYYNNATSAEMQELVILLQDSNVEAVLTPVLKELWAEQAPSNILGSEKLREMAGRIAAEAPAVSDAKHSPAYRYRVPLFKASWLRYAAILLLFAGVATFLYQVDRPQKIVSNISSTKREAILPGGNKATLTLSDGSIIVLDSAANGALANQGSMKIIKLDAGKLVYEGGNAGGAILYNTVSTPKGGQYQIGLPDGTKVWLNAASGVRFPTVFSNDRTIEITGEAYLEVAPDKNKPFFVKTAETTIHVLGTSFNVNAYGDEPAVKVSLLEGSVQAGATVLKPGQAYEAGKVMATDIEQDLAWKNGEFNFNNKPIEQVMRQLERWYDIEVVYENAIPTIQLAGEMTRDVPLDGVLDGLKTLGVRLRLEGKKLIVTH